MCAFNTDIYLQTHIHYAWKIKSDSFDKSLVLIFVGKVGVWWEDPLSGGDGRNVGISPADVASRDKSNGKPM